MDMESFSYRTLFSMCHARTWNLVRVIGSDYPLVKKLLYLIPQSVQTSLRKLYVVSPSSYASWAWRPGLRFHFFLTYCSSFLSFQSLRKVSFVYWKRQFRVWYIFVLS